MPVPAGGGINDWMPTVAQVAAYVPHRTLAQDVATNTAGEDVYRLTFDSTTRPTSTQVLQLIADGAAWVTSRVTPLNAVSEPAAALIATLYAAAMVERGWPADDSSLQRALDFEKRMDLMLGGLVVSNDDANDDGGVTDPSDVLPQYSFPAADTRYDYSYYW